MWHLLGISGRSYVRLSSRNLGKLLAAYRSAVRARMLIPVGLAAAMLAYNTLYPEQPLTLAQEVRCYLLQVSKV